MSAVNSYLRLYTANGYGSDLNHTLCNLTSFVYNTARAINMKNTSVLRLLTPSWVVNVVGVAVGVLATGAVIVLSRFQGSQLRQEIFEVRAQNTAPGATQTAYHNITTNIANNHVLGVAPLFIVWACVGLVVYYFTMAIARSFGQAAALREQMTGYVHISRQSLLRRAMTQLAIRALGVIGWFVFIKLSISFIVPYALAAANIASQNLTLTSIGYAVLAIVVLYADIYVHAVFLRVIALKPRLFGVS